MSGFYNTSVGPGASSSNSGFYNSGGGNTGGGIYEQQQQPQQGFSNTSQWQAPSQQQQQQAMYGQAPLQQQQPPPPGSQFIAGMQQQGAQVATQMFAQMATGSLTTEKVMENLGKGFGGGIPGLSGIMLALRGYFAVDNQYVKRKMVKVLFPFLNKQWKREVSDINVLIKKIVQVSAKPERHSV